MFSALAVTTLALAAASPPEVGCTLEGHLPLLPTGAHDVVLGPLTLMGVRDWEHIGRNAFWGKGYKIPTSLLDGNSVVLSVPPRLRHRVGFVYTLRAQRSVGRHGVRAADPAIRFTACAGDQRTAWAGGIVTNRRRCATLLLTAGDGQTIRRRVPLGRRC